MLTIAAVLCLLAANLFLFARAGLLDVGGVTSAASTCSTASPPTSTSARPPDPGLPLPPSLRWNPEPSLTLAVAGCQCHGRRHGGARLGR